MGRKALGRYLSRVQTNYLLDDIKKREELLNQFVQADFLRGYLYTDLMLVDITPTDTIREISQIVDHLTNKTARFIWEYYLLGDDGGTEHFDLSDCAGETNLLTVLTGVCDHLVSKYSFLTPRVLVTPKCVAKYPHLHRIETDIARLMALFFHYVGISPYRFELMCWTSYRYADDLWLKSELKLRPKNQAAI